MSRVELASLGSGIAQTGLGAVAPNQPGTIADHATGNPVPVYPTETSGSANTSGAFTTDHLGRVPGWVEIGSGLTVDITIPPADTVTSVIGGPVGPTGATGAQGIPGNPGVTATFRNPPQWSAIITYSAGPPPDAVLGSDGQFYYSLVTPNLGHNPVGDGNVHWASGLAASVESAVSAFQAGKSTTGGVNVWDSQTSPASVTDWGPVINALIAAGWRYLIFNENPFPFSTQIDCSGIGKAFIFEGASARIWPQAANVVPSYLLWKGSGTTHPINNQGGSGLTVRNLGLYWDNSGGSATFNGFVDHTSTAAAPLYESCDIRSWKTLQNTAKACVSFSNTVGGQVSRCSIAGAQWGVRGYESGGFSNAVVVEDCVFDSNGVAHIGNIGQEWVIRGNTFEMEDQATGLGQTPALINSDVAGTSTFSFADNWCGDAGASVSVTAFKQQTNNTWYAAFSGNFIQSFAGPLWKLGGGGAISITDNPETSPGSGAVVDLGDTTAGAVAFDQVTITGNRWSDASGPASDAIIHRAGHKQINIWGNGTGAGTVSLRTLGDHERLAWPDRQGQPSVAAQPALGTGASCVLIGSDIAGIISLSPGTSPTAGIIASITFAYPFDSEAPTPNQYLCVLLTPFQMSAGGTSGAAGAQAGMYVQLATPLVSTGFKIGVASALSTACLVAYRVIQL